MSYDKTEIVIYQTVDGLTKIDVRMENETVWLTQAQMVELFQSSKSNISEHINNVFDDGELTEESVVRNFRTTAADGKNYSTKFYNLDVVISVGYRVKSLRGTQFRRWALEILREYLIKGFAMNDDLLKKAGGGGYWKELLERIRDIRSNEKVFYRQASTYTQPALTMTHTRQNRNYFSRLCKISSTMRHTGGQRRRSSMNVRTRNLRSWGLQISKGKNERKAK